MEKELAAPKETIPPILINEDDLYEGNLIRYAKVVFKNPRGSENPYHNLRHWLHMLWLCYNACEFYVSVLTKRQMRNLLIAAMFHDFDHSGRAGNDDLNIEMAIRGLKKHILPEDKPYFEEICEIIRPTEYPYKVSAEDLSLSAQILRDADVTQAFSTAWIQQVLVGLAQEWGMSLIEVLEMQEPFLSKLQFTTEWAQKKFDKDTIQKKIAEARALLFILNT